MIESRFLALDGRELFIEWPPKGVDATSAQGATVDVYFEHDDARLAFRTQTHGPAAWTCPQRGGITAWRLATPLCVERRQQRDHCRESLDEFDPVMARFASVDEPTREFTARITNVSGGGLGSLAALDAMPRVQSTALYWANFELPGEASPFEFVVRLVHIRPDERRGVVILGCSFCPGEDTRLYRNQLQRIEHFVNQQRGARAGGASPLCLKGNSPC